MKYFKIQIIVVFLGVLIGGCKKIFLDAKPNTNIVTPTTLADLQNLLENDANISGTPSLPLLASDDYIFVDYASWLAAETPTERNSYIWAKDIYGGQLTIQDWNSGYTAIFYCNNVLEALSKISIDERNSSQYNFVKGWAYFMRAYRFYELTNNFASSYDDATSSSELGLPIRLKAGIDELAPRSSLLETYNQILSDLQEARILLNTTSISNTNHPSKAAVFALYSRILLSMRKYDKAEKYADSTLAINKKLIDYNTVNKTAASPFEKNNDETIYSSIAVNGGYSIQLPAVSNTKVTINPDLIKLYDPNDLRLTTFFRLNTATGNLYKRRGYFPGLIPFTGIATDEIYLIKAECLARRNEVPSALSFLNTLLKQRFPPINYKDITASDKIDALNKILLERRKELVWRTLRWSDLKRLNKDGANISLTRVLNGVTYTLPPNDSRYVFPIPDDEISLSGIKQNIR